LLFGLADVRIILVKYGGYVKHSLGTDLGTWQKIKPKAADGGRG